MMYFLNKDIFTEMIQVHKYPELGNRYYIYIVYDIYLIILKVHYLRTLISCQYICKVVDHVFIRYCASGAFHVIMQITMSRVA